MRHCSLKNELRLQFTRAQTTPSPGRGYVIVTKLYIHFATLLSKDSLALNWNTNWIQQLTSGNNKQAKAESPVGGSKPRPCGSVGKAERGVNCSLSPQC